MKENNLVIHNSMSRQKELFKPLHPDRVGMYVCGPTVMATAIWAMPARPSHSTSFSAIFSILGYKVRYVRNITDVGHLEHDADDGEDKIAKKARPEQLEPMEVVQFYLNRYHQAMDALNVLPPIYRATRIGPHHRAD